MKYRKRNGVSVVEAFRLGKDLQPQWFKQAINERIITVEEYRVHSASVKTIEKISIKTTDGVKLYAHYGQYIMRDSKRIIYICDIDYFENNYNLIER